VTHLFGNRTFLFLLFGALALLPLVANVYQLFIGNLMMLYVILAVGLNLLIGYAGQLAFANAAMYGIGAYGTGLLIVKAGWPFWLAAPGGALIAMAIGTLMAFPALRLSGIYLAMVTLAFAQFTQWVMLHWQGLTFGAGGFAVPEVRFGPVSPDHGIYYLTWLVAIARVWLAWNIVRSRLGRAFTAMRDGEVAAQALGVDLLRYKVMAFALSGFYAGTAGALYCAVLKFVSPESFDLFQMVLHKAMVVVGGIGSVVGSVLGASLLVFLIEVLREFKGTQEIVFGSLLLAFMLFQPNGLVALLKRWVPGWVEPLHLPPAEAALPATQRPIGLEAGTPVAAERS
jgi:branched-chain amino acid transport system permease protein